MLLNFPTPNFSCFSRGWSTYGSILFILNRNEGLTTSLYLLSFWSPYFARALGLGFAGLRQSIIIIFFPSSFTTTLPSYAKASEDFVISFAFALFLRFPVRYYYPSSIQLNYHLLFFFPPQFADHFYRQDHRKAIAARDCRNLSYIVTLHFSSAHRFVPTELTT